MGGGCGTTPRPEGVPSKQPNRTKVTHRGEAPECRYRGLGFTPKVLESEWQSAPTLSHPARAILREWSSVQTPSNAIKSL